ITLSHATGWSYSEKDLRRIGERIFVLERAFILREGFTSRDDRLPERFTKEPAPVGPNKGHIVEIDDMLREYYRLRDWDERGYPSYQKMEELDLLDVASELGIEE
ncbi:MAG: aldehyde:ferredoxin oxidoreductase, partial [Methanomicrobia archaeon]|nr:aldehyde:ferredoxin oxidoreductase [Methanomicrobia archaeon]